MICIMSAALTGCSVARGTAKAVGTAGKITFATVKTVGKVAGKTAQLTGRGIKTVVNMASGKQIVKCSKLGNSLVVNTLINKQVKANLIVDTGCTETQISEGVARGLGIDTNSCPTVQCQLADGRTVAGKEVNIKEIRLGRVRVKNVRAIVLGTDQMDHSGLLGMSFLENFIFKVDSEKQELVLQKRIR